jgi:hypothetical protein
MRARVAVFALFAVTACVRIGPAFRASAAPEERPGLGTIWGETRSSPLREVPFERASSVPFAQGTLFYDDSDGVEAMAGRDQLSDAAPPAYAGLETAVVDDRGQPLETVWAAGRIYVVGEEGRRYRLRVHNRTARRVEVVASVDGLDVMDGRGASLEKRGYLVEPHGTLTIDGFRRNLSEVAAFRFGAVPDSYAARTGEDRNVGVIGFAFFDERWARFQEHERSDEAERRRNARPFSDSRFAQPPGM